MQNQIISLGLNPRNFTHIHKIRAALFANQQSIGEFSIAQDLIDQSAEALFDDVAVLLVLFQRALQDFAKAIFAHGLQQIIERMHLESAYGVMIVRGDKNKSWRVRRAAISID